MHGNLWEWCADGIREYQVLGPGEVLLDPTGPQDPGQVAPHVVRGGSWISDAGDARSAYRFQERRGHRYHFRGFRLCLRS